MSDRRHYYVLIFSGPETPGEWRILRKRRAIADLHNDPLIWKFPWRPEHDELGQPPLEVREKYEQLLSSEGWSPELETPVPNLVEMMANEDDCAWDQPCIHGYRVEHHAVYCHNHAWLYAPRKCRRTQGPSVWGEKAWPHEECPGFKPNPLYAGDKCSR